MVKRGQRYAAMRNVRFVLEIAVFVGIVFLVVTFAMTASILPITQEEYGGIVRAVGVRKSIFVIFMLGGAVTGGLFLLSRFPRLLKYPVEIGPTNVEVQYHMAKLLLCVWQFITLAATCLLMVRVYRQTVEIDEFSFWGIIIVAAVLYGATFAVYYIAARKYKNE